jgi:YD repeat-containing protein
MTSADVQPGIKAAVLNHVSIPARDLDESERFYVQVFGLERIPAPNFGFPVRWLRLGDRQLHLQILEPEVGASRYQHFALEVDDFEGAYRRLVEWGAFETGSRYEDLWLLPSGEVQMFVRDPAGNMVEIDWPDVHTLDLAVFDHKLRVLADEQPQGETNRFARLFDLDHPTAASPAADRRTDHMSRRS